MKKALFLVLSSLFLLGCSSDSESSGSGTITMKFNGEFITAKVTSVTLSYIDGEGKRLDISAQNKSNTFQIALASTSMGEEFNSNEYSFENSNFDDNQALFFTSYKLGGNTYGEHFPSEVSIYKTTQDVNNNTISGAFTAVLDKSFALQDEIDTPEQIVITEGKFSNLKYTVYQ